MNSWLRLLTILVSLIFIGSPAAAHPHVWVVLKSQIVYDKAGLATGVRHVWTFDDVYSAFLTQGIKPRTKGIFTRDELASIAKENIESLTISRKRRSMAARPRLRHLSNTGLNRKTDR